MRDTDHTLVPSTVLYDVTTSNLVSFTLQSYPFPAKGGSPPTGCGEINGYKLLQVLRGDTQNVEVVRLLRDEKGEYFEYTLPHIQHFATHRVYTHETWEHVRTHVDTLRARAYDRVHVRLEQASRELRHAAHKTDEELEKLLFPVDYQYQLRERLRRIAFAHVDKILPTLSESATEDEIDDVLYGHGERRV